MPQRSQRPNRYRLRGRVLRAIFNCPRCDAWIFYERHTGYRLRCPNPECRKVWYVALYLRDPRYVNRITRPPDTITPVLSPVDAMRMMRAAAGTAETPPPSPRLAGMQPAVGESDEPLASAPNAPAASCDPLMSEEAFIAEWRTAGQPPLHAFDADAEAGEMRPEGEPEAPARQPPPPVQPVQPKS